MRQVNSYTLGSAIAPRTITSSTNATPIEVTKASHGLVTGDKITIFGHTTNTAANGTWTVTKTGANTFTLDDSVGNGVGGADGCFAKLMARILVEDFEDITVSIDTDGGADAVMTVKCVGSIQDDVPDFADTKSPTNQYEYLCMIDLEDASGLDGDTGFVVATADDNRLFSVNVDGIRWLSFVPTAGTEGEVTIKARCYC